MNDLRCSAQATPCSGSSRATLGQRCQTPYHPFLSSQLVPVACAPFWVAEADRQPSRPYPWALEIYAFHSHRNRVKVVGSLLSAHLQEGGESSVGSEVGVGDYQSWALGLLSAPGQFLPVLGALVSHEQRRALDRNAEEEAPLGNDGKVSRTMPLASPTEQKQSAEARLGCGFAFQR